MRLGLINELHGGGAKPAPTWESILERARLAEDLGFDLFVFEDALLYRGEESTEGVWESFSVAAGLAASTERIEIGQSVVNSPYRSPALTASIVTSLDEISGGRYVFGIGAGNTWDSDYRAFGFHTDKRFSRFAEAIAIIHSLLKTGRADWSGEFYSVADSQLILRGPRPEGPPINIAAGGPKMLDLVAKYADAWNWWAYDETFDQLRDRYGPILETLGLALEREARDPGDLTRTLDFYSVLAPGFEPPAGRPGILSGSPDEIADFIRRLSQLGFSEVRVDVWPNTNAAMEAMAPVVTAVQDG